jgi:hypothetical protein
MLASEDINIDLSLREINQINTLVHDQNMTVEDLEKSVLAKFNLADLEDRKLSLIKLNGRDPLDHERTLKIIELRKRDLKITFYLDDILSFLLFNYNSSQSNARVENMNELSKFIYLWRILGKEKQNRYCQRERNLYQEMPTVQSKPCQH